MVIGFDGSRAFANWRTGTENYSYQLLKALARLDSAKRAKIDRVNNYIVYTKPFISDVITERMKLPKNFKIVEIKWLRLWTQCGLAMQTFKDNLDVLFVPAHTLPVIRKPALKTVVTVHDLGSEYLPSMHQLKQRLYLSFMQRFQLKSASKIIAVSKATKSDLIKRVDIEGDKIKVVYEGYDKDLFKPAIDEKPKTYYLFVGTVQPRKNLERIIKAFAIHLRGVPKEKRRSHLGGEVKLVIAGQKGWMSDEIYRLPKRLGIEDRVKFLGYVVDKDLPALYSGAIALLLPSLFEGFGLPILEAQASGCPVITSNVSSMPEVVGKGALLVDPLSVDDIVRGMGEIGETREKLIKAGFENVRRFSWEKCARETLEVLLSS